MKLRVQHTKSAVLIIHLSLHFLFLIQLLHALASEVQTNYFNTCINYLGNLDTGCNDNVANVVQGYRPTCVCLYFV